MNFTSLLNALPGSVAQGLIWGLLTIGVYITFKVLDYSDMTVDGSMATGGAVAVMLMLNGTQPLPRTAGRHGSRYAGRFGDRRIPYRIWHPRHPFGHSHPAGAVFHQYAHPGQNPIRLSA